MLADTRDALPDSLIQSGLPCVSSVEAMCDLTLSMHNMGTEACAGRPPKAIASIQHILACMQVGAHEVLADLLMRYMAELSSTSHSYAELAGRTATNVSDVVSH